MRTRSMVLPSKTIRTRREFVSAEQDETRAPWSLLQVGAGRGTKKFVLYRETHGKEKDQRIKLMVTCLRLAWEAVDISCTLWRVSLQMQTLTALRPVHIGGGLL